MKRTTMKKTGLITLLSFLILFVLTIIPASSLAAFSNSGWVWPVPASKHMSQGFKDGHTGIDILSDRGENETVVASRNGTVVAVFGGCYQWDGYYKDHSGCDPVAHLVGYDQWGIRNRQTGYNDDGSVFYNDVCNCGFGNGVVIDHGDGVFSMYCHMATTSVSAGQYVTAGTTIGTMGSYGFSSGRHLHFEIKVNCHMNGYWPSGDSINDNPYGSEYPINDYDWNNYVDNIWYQDYAPSYADLTGARQAYILVADHPEFALAVNPDTNNVEIAAKADTVTQLWSFTKQSDETYIIASLYNGKVLDAESAGTADGTNVQVYSDGGGSNQRWYAYMANGGDTFAPKYAPGKRLDVNGGTFVSGQNVQIWSSNDSTAQLFSPYYQNDIILPTAVSFGDTDLEMRPGETAEFYIEYTPWNTNRKGLVWTTSDSAVVSVDSNGKVTAVGEGTATVTATSTFNPSITATRRFIVASPVEKPQITELNVNGKAVTLSWTESPLTNDTDVRAYEVYVYSKGTTTNPVWSDTNVTTTSCAITMMAHGEYTAYVRAVNKTESTYSKYSSQNFTILDGDWLYTDTVPENFNDAEIQYLNHYEDKEQAESPGAGWTQGASHTHYTNGDVIYSHDRMATSDTLVEIGTYYYHFCDGSSEVERFWTERFCNETNLDNNGQFDVVAEYTDSDPNYKVYRLRWNSGEWAGGLATCPYGSNDAMALYYLGYRYQQRTVNVTYTWTKEDEWSFERDPNASVTSYRIRTLTYDNQLHIPTGTTRIEAEAFMGDTTIEEVFVPTGCEYIGSKAFAGCTGLKRIHIPVNTVVEADAFEGCEQVTIVRE